MKGLTRTGNGARLAALLLLLTSCGARERGLPAQPGPDELRLIRPSHGDTVAGEVELSAYARLASPVHSLVFLIDGEPCDTLTEPPWRTVWSSDAPAEGREARMRVCASIESGEGPRSEEVVVWVWPDAPPIVRITLPARARWTEATAEAALSAIAEDPEEGILPEKSIAWSGSALAREIRGAALPLTLLPEVEQRVTASARDAWGRAGAHTIRIRPFRYRPEDRPEDPAEDCLWNLAAAIRARDAEACALRLAPEFIFLPCAHEAVRARWDPVWRREIFALRLADWLEAAGGDLEPEGADGLREAEEVADEDDDEDGEDVEEGTDDEVASIEWEWRLGPPVLWMRGAEERVWYAGAVVEIQVPSSGRGAGTIRMIGSAGLLVARVPGSPWRLQEWRDLPADSSVSFATLLAATAGLAIPRRGAGCGVVPAPPGGVSSH